MSPCARYRPARRASPRRSRCSESSAISSCNPGSSSSASWSASSSRRCSGGEALQERLELRGLPRQLVEELVEALDAREHLAPAVHEALDVGLAARGLLSEEPVEVAHHVPETVRPLGAETLEALLELAEQALRHLLAEPEHQLLELAPGLGIDELVVLEPAHGAAQVLRQGIQRRAALVRDALELLAVRLGRGVAALGGLPRGVHPAVDPLTLGVEDVLERPPEVAEDVAEVVPVEQRPALAAQPLEEVAEARHLIARARAEALPEEPLERAARIAVGDEVVFHRGQEVVRVEVRKGLGAVPAGVPAPHAVLYRGPPPAPRSLLSFMLRCRPSSTNSTAAATRAGCPAAPSLAIAAPRPAALRGLTLVLRGRHPLAHLEREPPAERLEQLPERADLEVAVEDGEHGLLGEPLDHLALVPVPRRLELDLAGRGRERRAEIRDPRHGHRLAEPHGPAERVRDQVLVVRDRHAHADPAALADLRAPAGEMGQLGDDLPHVRRHSTW